MEDKYYVYFHRRLDNNQVFYVGKGCGSRAWQTKGRRTEYWHNIVNKHGYKVEIFANNLTEEDSFKIEIEQIAYHRSIGIELCNMTDGGEGISNIKDCTRDKMRNAKLGKISSKSKPVVNQLGDVFQNAKLAGKWCGINGKNINSCCHNKKNYSGIHPKTGEKLVWVFVGQEYLIQEKLIILQTLQTNIPKKIINQFGDIFNSIKEAATWCNGQHNNISRCCHGKYKTAHQHPETGEDLIWLFLEDKDNLPKRIEEAKNRYNCIKKKVINQFGEVFNSAHDAAKFCNSHNANINACCNGKRKSTGVHPTTGEKLMWKFLDEVDNPPHN